MMYIKFIVIILLKLNVVQYCSAIDIQNVTTTGMIASPYAYSGVVTVKFQDVWGYVCYYGSKKRWGKREATTACKQLGYMGGWPTMNNETESSTHNLYNFDCDEYLEDLNYCEFDATLICEQTMLAGIQCFDSFHIDLIGGKAPNVGRIQVKYDTVTSDVCYRQEDSSQWSFYNTQVLCREMGYPGAMPNTKSSENVLTGESQISGYHCKSDLRESSLQECNPDFPIQKSSEKCNAVTVACAAPGYVGCFDNKILSTERQNSFKSENMTINECRHYCRNEVYRYAFLSRGDTCACSTDITGNPVSDKLCSMDCFGDGDLVCGDNCTSSVYDVKLGTCDDPLDGNLVYFFGEEFTRDCKSGSQVSEQVSMQCVVSNETGEIVWSAFEDCPDKGGSDEDANNSDLGLEKTPSIILGMAICIVFIIFIAVVCSLYRSRKVHNERDQEIDENNSKQSDDKSTEDVEMNVKGDHEESSKTQETSKESQNRLEDLKKQDDSCQETNEENERSKFVVFLFGKKKTEKEESPKHEGNQKGEMNLTPIDNYFGNSTAVYENTKNLADQDVTYKNKSYFRRAKKHKSGYTEVPDIDPDIYRENINNESVSQTLSGEHKEGQRGKTDKERKQITGPVHSNYRSTKPNVIEFMNM